MGRRYATLTRFGTWLGFYSGMLRRCACIALAVILVGLSTAQAADTTLTLACQGTTLGGTEDAKPEPVSMGIIINFTKMTVQGFGDPGLLDYPVKISGINDVTVSFGGSHESGPTLASIIGSLDRVTGDLNATSMVTNTKTSKIGASTSYVLKCRPTQRMF